MRSLLFLTLLFLCSSGWADQTADGLGSAADELDAIVADLEESQAQAARLQDRLALLERLAEVHQVTLADQAAELDRYRSTVALAEDLARRLAQEQGLNRWLMPVATIAVAASLVEGWLLFSR